MCPVQEWGWDLLYIGKREHEQRGKLPFSKEKDWYEHMRRDADQMKRAASMANLS